MTRTVKSPRLPAHLVERFLELHPDDVLRTGVATADLVEVFKPWVGQSCACLSPIGWSRASPMPRCTGPPRRPRWHGFAGLINRFLMPVTAEKGASTASRRQASCDGL
jgi:hypothetical protein